MAVNSAKMTGGKLSFGEAGSLKEWAGQITSCTAKPEAGKKEEVKVLSGETVVDVSEESWTLEGSVLQDYTAESLIKWCSQNAGSEVKFTFKASGTQPLTISGVVVVASIGYGGDVDQRNKSEFSFPIVGKPKFT